MTDETPKHDAGPEYQAAAQHTLANLARAALANQWTADDPATLAAVASAFAQVSIAESLVAIRAYLTHEVENIVRQMADSPSVGDIARLKPGVQIAGLTGKELRILSLDLETIKVERTDRPGMPFVISDDDWEPIA